LDSSKKRMELFSDAVFGIIITMMVLEIKIPAGGGIMQLRHLLKDIFIFFISFLIVALSWERHHNIFEEINETNRQLIWLNFFLLFFLALFPLFTRWVALEMNNPLAVAGYGILFVIINFIFGLLMMTALTLLKDPEHKKAARTFMVRRRQAAYRIALFFLMQFIVVIGVITLSFLFPKALALFFMGFPVIMLLMRFKIGDLWQQKRDRLEKHRELTL
jgi:uncharacterized membrane protein